MSEIPHSTDGLEAMAFQVVLQKLLGLERGLASMERALKDIPPLLKKIIDQLEAQTATPEVPVATFADVYPELQELDDDEGPTGEDAIEAEVPAGPAVRRTRFLRWFLREDQA